MSIFQTCFFIIEIIFYLILGASIAISPEILLGINKDTSHKIPEYGYLEVASVSNRTRIRQIKPWKLIWFIIVMSFTFYLIKPYILDVPQLVTGKLNYVTGKVQDIRTKSKDPTHYVYLYGGGMVEFFFSSGVNKYERYKIGYLTHTRRAIYCEQIDAINGNNKVIGFPVMDILSYLAILGVVIFIGIISQYIKFKLFIPVNIISFPAFTYFFIKYGIDNDIWFSVKNDGFSGLIFCSIGLFLTLFLYFIEKLKPRDNYVVSFFFAQVFSLLNIGFLICLVFNIN